MNLTKFFTLLGLGASLAFGGFSAQALDYKSYSFLNQKVTSFMLTNGIGATNLMSLSQAGNTAAATNFSLSTAVTFQYTNATAFTLPTYSNYWVLGGISQTQYGAVLPGNLVVDVLSNVTAAPGVFGVLPVNATNTTIVATNDTQNMFQDVIWPPDSPFMGMTFQSTTTTTNANVGSIMVQMLPTIGSQSNYVSILFVPLVKGKGPILGYDAGKEPLMEVSDLGSGLSAAGFPPLQPFILSFTNSPTTTAKPGVYAAGIPPAYISGSAGLRIRAAYVGTAAASGLAGEWIQEIKYSSWAP